MIVFAAIAPHGDVGELRPALEELGRRFEAASPDTTVVVTPHTVHVERHFAVVTAARVGEWECDRDVAQALLAADLPILGVSYGGNDPAQAGMPLDWGTAVPLEFLRAKRIVVVSPARDLPLELHLKLGESLASNSLLQARRIALVASADHAHAHDPSGPYGFDPAAARYDGLLQEILGSRRLDFLPLAEHVEAAKADSLWQLLVLQGAMGEDARADLLAYGAPTYYGMAVAEVSA